LPFALFGRVWFGFLLPALNRFFFKRYFYLLIDPEMPRVAHIVVGVQLTRIPFKIFIRKLK